VLVNEIFKSICGEGTELGQIAVFVRFTGCDMRCAYPCDTQYSFEGGERYTVEELAEKIKSFGVRRIFWTGGEPMLQEEGMREVISFCRGAMAGSTSCRPTESTWWIPHC